MTVLVHISDLHFGRENPRLIEGLLRSLEEIQPRLIIISGDLTQRARKLEFLAARAFLESLRWPLLVISGNHDIPAYNLADRFLRPWRKWHRYFGYTLQPMMRDTDYIAIGVNTARRSGSYFDWSRGRINSVQLGAIAAYLMEDKGERLRVVAAHHPFWLPEKYRHRRTIGGGDAALNILKKIGVDIILSGHVHFAYTRIVNGLIISHAGTAISNRVEADSPNSFTVIRGDRRRLSVHNRIWDNSSFAKKDALVFHRIEGDWQETAQATTGNGSYGKSEG